MCSGGGGGGLGTGRARRGGKQPRQGRPVASWSITPVMASVPGIEPGALDREPSVLPLSYQGGEGERPSPVVLSLTVTLLGPAPPPGRPTWFGRPISAVPAERPWSGVGHVLTAVAVTDRPQRAVGRGGGSECHVCWPRRWLPGAEAGRPQWRDRGVASGGSCVDRGGGCPGLRLAGRSGGWRVVCWLRSWLGTAAATVTGGSCWHRIASGRRCDRIAIDHHVLINVRYLVSITNFSATFLLISLAVQGAFRATPKVACLAPQKRSICDFFYSFGWFFFTDMSVAKSHRRC